jgi:hypothetical protein
VGAGWRAVDCSRSTPQNTNVVFRSAVRAAHEWYDGALDQPDCSIESNSVFTPHTFIPPPETTRMRSLAPEGTLPLAAVPPDTLINEP